MRTGQRWAGMIVLVAGCVASAIASNIDLNMCGPAPEAASLEAGSLRENVLNLAGEWEGAVNVRYSDKETGSSLASVSCQRNAQGDGIVAVFEGYARGQAFQGAFSIRVDERSGVIETTSYDSRSSSKASLAGPIGEVRNAFVATGKDLRQVLRMERAGEYTIEWFALDTEGKETLVMSLDVSRMKEGRTSAAKDLFKDGKLLAMIDADGAVTANVVE